MEAWCLRWTVCRVRDHSKGGGEVGGACLWAEQRPAEPVQPNPSSPAPKADLLGSLLPPTSALLLPDHRAVPRPSHFLPPSQQPAPSSEVSSSSQRLMGQLVKEYGRSSKSFLGPKITVDGDCSHDIKRRLLLGRKAMTNPDSILKSRDIVLPTKVHPVKAMILLVVMYGYESWTIKKAERQIIDAFELRCWRRLLRVPWTARRSNQSTLKGISPKYSWEGLTLKLQYFGHLMQRADSLEKTLMLGKIGGGRRRG